MSQMDVDYAASRYDLQNIDVYAGYIPLQVYNSYVLESMTGSDYNLANSVGRRHALCVDFDWVNIAGHRRALYVDSDSTNIVVRHHV